MASLSPGREYPAVLSAAVGGDWSHQRIVIVGSQGLQQDGHSSASHAVAIIKNMLAGFGQAERAAE